MTNADILLLLIVGGAFLFGFFWGVIRGLLALAACVVVFVLAAHISLTVGDWLAQQWRNLSPEYVHTLAFLMVFAVLFVVSLVLIQYGARGSGDLSRYPLVDDLLGGLLGAAIAILVVAVVTTVLATFYGPTAATKAGDVEWSRKLYEALLTSTLGGQIAQSLVPGMISLLGPLLPGSIRDVL